MRLDNLVCVICNRLSHVEVAYMNNGNTLTLVFDDRTIVVLSAGFPVGHHGYLSQLMDAERMVGDSDTKLLAFSAVFMPYQRFL
jgi:hypothetical protein